MEGLKCLKQSNAVYVTAGKEMHSRIPMKASLAIFIAP